MYDVEQGRDKKSRSPLNSEEMSWFGSCSLQPERAPLVGVVNGKLTLQCTRTSYNSMLFSFNEHLLINQQFVCKIMFRVCQEVFRRWRNWDSEMASPEPRLKSNRESIEDHWGEGHNENKCTTTELWNKLKEWNNITPELSWVGDVVWTTTFSSHLKQVPL